VHIYYIKQYTQFFKGTELYQILVVNKLKFNYNTGIFYLFLEVSSSLIHFNCLFGTTFNLVYYPDDDRDIGRNMSVMNNMW
jgi:hypothetical protein